MSANLGKSIVTIRLEKFRFHFNPKERQCQRMIKLPIIELNSHASKVKLKIFQARPYQYVSRELPEVQTVFWRGRGTRDQIDSVHWIVKKTWESQKTLLLLYWLHWSLWLCEPQKIWKILKVMRVPRYRHSTLWSQVGLRKHHYEQS